MYSRPATQSSSRGRLFSLVGAGISGQDTTPTKAGMPPKPTKVGKSDTLGRRKTLPELRADRSPSVTNQEPLHATTAPPECAGPSRRLSTAPMGATRPGKMTAARPDSKSSTRQRSSSFSSELHKPMGSQRPPSVPEGMRRPIPPPTPDTASSRQQQYHKGLVDALQQVLRRQRQHGLNSLYTDDQAPEEGSKEELSKLDRKVSHQNVKCTQQHWTRKQTAEADELERKNSARREKRLFGIGRRSPSQLYNSALADDHLFQAMFTDVHLPQSCASTAASTPVKSRHDTTSNDVDTLPCDNLLVLQERDERGDIEYGFMEQHHELIREFAQKKRRVSLSRGGVRAAALRPVVNIATDNAETKRTENQAHDCEPRKFIGVSRRPEWERLKQDGNAAYASKEFVVAHRHYTMAVEANPSNPILLTNRAAASYMLMNYPAVVKDCLLATQIDETLTKAYGRMAKAYLLMGKYTVARRHYDQAVEGAGKDTAEGRRLLEELTCCDHLEQGNKLADLGKHFEAVKKFAEATCLLQEPAIALKRLASMVVVDPAVARVEIAQYLENVKPPPAESSTIGGTPRGVLLHNLRMWYAEMLFVLSKASFYCGQHYTGIARTYAEQVLEHSPDHRGAHKLMTVIGFLESKMREASDLSRSGNHREAHRCFSAALESGTDNNKLRAVLLVNRAMESYKLHDYSGVVRDCNQAEQLDSGYVKVYTIRADARKAETDYRRAVKDMRAAVQLNPALKPDLDDLLAEEEEARLNNMFSGTSGGSFNTADCDSEEDDHCFEGLYHSETLYDVLGVKRNADAATIKRQYRQLTLQLHPDKCVGLDPQSKVLATSRFKEVAHAYSVLSDPASRATYNASLRR